MLKADKENKTVLMQREDYVTKMKALIDNENTYEKLNRDPTYGLQSANNKFIR